MTDISQTEAKEILIAMTKSGMKFDGSANNENGALVFTNEKDDFRNAYVKMASLVAGHAVTSFAVTPVGKKERYEIHNEDIVKQMVGYCAANRGAALA